MITLRNSLAAFAALLGIASAAPAALAAPADTPFTRLAADEGIGIVGIHQNNDVYWVDDWNKIVRHTTAGSQALVYRAPRGTWISFMRVRGDSIVLRLQTADPAARVQRTQVVMLPVVGGRPRTLATGKWLRRKACGTVAHLLFVSETGEAVVDRETRRRRIAGCGRRNRESWQVSGQRLDGTTRRLYEGSARLSQTPLLDYGRAPAAELEGDKLLVVARRWSQVRDLATGSLTTYRAPAGWVESHSLGPGGTLVATAYRINRNQTQLVSYPVAGDAQTRLVLDSRVNYLLFGRARGSDVIEWIKRYGSKPGRDQFVLRRADGLAVTTLFTSSELPTVWSMDNTADTLVLLASKTDATGTAVVTVPIPAGPF